MRTDASYRSVSSNGYSSHSPSHAVRKAHVSHSYSAAANGTHSPVINGKSKRRAARTAAYRGHNREELTRILIQGLRDMGYVHAADTLSEESGYELEGPEVGAFRLAVLNGRWSQAERLLLGPDPGAPATTSENGDTSLTGLALAENADKHQMLFDIRQQKFLELLVQRNLLGALKVLREELAPLNHDTRALHRLSSLLMCTSKDLESQMKWPSDPDQARQRLLEDLANSIAPSVMIRDHRLAELLDQVKQAQINECLYHNSSVPPSLYSDHKCLQEDFPSNTWMILEEHTDEVYCVEFSPDGRYLATAGNDKTLIIHDTSSFRPIQKFTEHPHAIVKIAWSPDSRKVLTAENGPQARVWDVVTGRRLITVEHNTNRETKVTAGAWLPNSTSFVTGSHDVDTKMCLWSLTATDPRKPAFTWHGGGCRVSELAVTPDGKHLICNDITNATPRLFLYSLQSMSQQELFKMTVSSRITCITASRDSRTILISLEEGLVQMVDLEERCVVKRYVSVEQDKHIIRNCFGGAAENFVLSGSKDGGIFVWHKDNQRLIEKLFGHGKGQSRGDHVVTCTTSVSWHPRDAGMFASGGDDRKVRIWANTAVDDSSMIFDPRTSHPDLQRTSAMRSTSSL